MGLEIKYRDGCKYQLLEDHAVRTPFLGMPSWERPFSRYDGVTAILHLKTGLAWNGASGPTFDSSSSMAPSGEHDECYGAIEGGWGVDMTANRVKRAYQAWIMRRRVDMFFAARLVECGMAKWRAKLWLWGVRKFGGSHAVPGKKQEVRTAPAGASAIDLKSAA
jgi:hypothetical protein